jgi:type IV pilus assembly protein PilP
MKQMSKTFQIGLLVICGLFLTGCENKSKKDLEDWVAQVKLGTGQEIEQIPPFTPYERIIYSHKDRRSPFIATKLLTETEELAVEQSCRPDLIPDKNRIKEELESYQLDSFDLIGVMDFKGATWAILRGSGASNAGFVYKVLVGNFIGNNNGRIVRIYADRVEVEELFPDGLGCYEKKTTFIQLEEV